MRWCGHHVSLCVTMVSQCVTVVNICVVWSSICVTEAIICVIVVIIFVFAITTCVTVVIHVCRGHSCVIVTWSFCVTFNECDCPLFSNKSTDTT